MKIEKSLTIDIKSGWQNLWNEFLELTKSFPDDFVIININQSNGLQIYWNKFDHYLNEYSEMLYLSSLETCEETGMVGSKIEINGITKILNKKLKAEFLKHIS